MVNDGAKGEGVMAFESPIAMMPKHVKNPCIVRGILSMSYQAILKMSLDLTILLKYGEMIWIYVWGNQ